MKNKKAKVLIVDDSQLIANRLKIILSDMHEVSFISHALNESEAMAIMEMNTHDIVLLDIKLPGKSGIEVLLGIKRLYKHVNVIMLTNFNEIYYRNLCKQMGAEYFFDKSTEFEMVPFAIKALIYSQN